MKPTTEQQAVIDAQEGTVLVLAAVGSGKTTTLAHRLARTLDEGLAPERVLAVTFTNRAATHLRAALEERVGDQARRVEIRTFHALCARILRAEADNIGLPPDFRICDEEDGAEILGELGVDRPTRALYDMHAEASAVPMGGATVALWSTGAFSTAAWAGDYAAALGDRGAVDFAGLVLLSRALLTGVEPAIARWSHRFDAVLVDEVQDTHLSEYEVLAVLARNARSVCLVGDLDQTIYGWRGSSPEALLTHLARDLGPVQRLSLTACFRATRSLLDFADRLADQMVERATSCFPADSLPEGEPPTVRRFVDATEEERAIARYLRERIADGLAPEEVAILVRANVQVGPLGIALKEAGVPHATVDQFRFFRRKEVKDALALAALVVDRRDEGAARRVAQRLVAGVGRATNQRILRGGARCGLRMADLLDEALVEAGDPMAGLAEGEVVVLDTETTGTEPLVDEVIEIGAVVMADGKATEERFQIFLRNTRPVGESEGVHHISDATLAAEGVDPHEAFTRLLAFLDNRPIAGHNVVFDVDMLQAHAARVDLELPLAVAFDTLPLARRMVAAASYRLGDLVKSLELDVPPPTHRAVDDVLATIALAAWLQERARQQEGPRRMLLQAEAPQFARLRRTLDLWARAGLRPDALIERITADALRHKYPGEPWRMHNLSQLAARLRALDEPALPPGRALKAALVRAALVRDVDSLDQEGGVRIVTIHQSKGLEFTEVVVPGLVEGGLPSWRSLKGTTSGDLDEERRLLYVAVTRARERVLLTTHDRDHRGRSTSPSRFLTELGVVPETAEALA